MTTALLAGACDDDDDPTGPESGISFAPSGAPSARSLYLEEAGAGSSTTLILVLRAQQVTDLYGINFQLEYPANLISFTQATKGTFLSAGGAFSTSFQVAEARSGELVVGVTRLGQVNGANGSGDLVRIQFESTGTAGAAALGFSHNEAFSSQLGKTLNVNWIAGQVTVTP